MREGGGKNEGKSGKVKEKCVVEYFFMTNCRLGTILRAKVKNANRQDGYFSIYANI